MMTLEMDGRWLRLTGRLDVHTVGAAFEALRGLQAAPAQVDATALEGLDTAGVQWLFVLARRHGGALEVKGASKTVTATLAAAGFAGWVTR
jgi:ABC-type transporter Mla MlaB component